MLDSMFGLEFSLPMKFFIAFAIVLILIGAAAYLLRRFGTGALAVSSQRNRQPRLAVVDTTAIDNRRKLVIVRRDNVEHLLLIGGPTDVLIEPNIVRASSVQSVRDVSAVRTTSAEPLSLPEAGGWPLAPETPQPAVRAEPAVRPPQPHIPVPQMPATHVQPQLSERPIPSVAPALAQAQPTPSRTAAPVAPPAPSPAPLSVRPQPAEAATHAPETRAAHPATPVAPRPAAQPQAPAVFAAPQAETVQAAAVQIATEAPSPSAAALVANEEQNLADMAHRLEAALRGPTAAAPATSPRPPAAAPRSQTVPPPPAAAQRGQAPSYESLQREMASLLGRQPGGS